MTAFWKLSGAGNDFVLLSPRPRGSLTALARKLCDRRRGIGADGLLVVTPGRIPRVDYLNADGSRAFCGNGTRCAAVWLSRRGLAGKRFVLRTGQGPLAIRVLGPERAAVRMPRPRSVHLPRTVRAGGRPFKVVALDTGVPHAVVFVERLDSFPVVALGRALRRHPAFGRAGANVDFVQIKGRNLRLRTYERGVEDETLACGTGVVAAALAAALLRGARSPVRVATRGGDVLRVAFKRGAAGFDEVWLEGPAVTVYEGEI